MLQPLAKRSHGSAGQEARRPGGVANPPAREGPGGGLARRLGGGAAGQGGAAHPAAREGPRTRRQGRGSGGQEGPRAWSGEGARESRTWMAMESECRVVEVAVPRYRIWISNRVFANMNRINLGI